MIQRYRHITQRTDAFTLDLNTELGRGLMAAYLAPGGLAGSTHYPDLSGNNHCSLLNMPASNWGYSPDLRRSILTFPGVWANCVLGSTSMLRAVGTDLTAACWIKTAADASQYLINNMRENSQGWGLCTYNSPSRCLVWRSDTKFKRTATNAFANDTWTHVAARFNATALTCDIFSNGRLFEQLTDCLAIDNSTYPFVIGEHGRYAAGELYSRAYNGDMADPCIWYRALSDGEIASLADPSNVMLSGLILPPRRTAFPAATAAPSVPSGHADLSAVASLTAIGHTAHAGSATLTAIAGVDAGGYAAHTGTATLDVVANLSPAGYVMHSGTADLDAIASLAAAGYTAHTGHAELSAIAEIDATGQAPSLVPEGYAALDAVASITATGHAAHTGMADLTAIASIEAVGQAPAVMSAEGYAVLDVVADLAATGYAEAAGYAGLSAVGVMSAVGDAPGETPSVRDKTADGLTWPDVDGLTWAEADGLPWCIYRGLVVAGQVYTPGPTAARAYTPAPAAGHPYIPGPEASQYA